MNTSSSAEKSPETVENATPLAPRDTMPTGRPDDAYRHGFFFAFGAATLALILFLSYKLLGAIVAIATPFVGALVLSLLLEPLVRLAQARVTAGNRGRAVGLVFGIFLTALITGGSYAVPALATQTQRLVRFFTPVTYTVARSTGEADRFVSVADGIADTAFTVKNLTNGSNYQFIVYAVNADGERAASPVVSAIPGVAESTLTKAEKASGEPVPDSALPVLSPQDVDAHAGDGAVKLIWQPPAGGQSGFDKLRKQVDLWLVRHPKIGPFALPHNLDALTTQYSDQISQRLKMSAGQVTSVALDSVTVLINVVLVPIIAVFILSDMDRLRARLYLFLPDTARRFAQTTALEISEVFGKYLRGLFTICSMYGGACMTYLLVVSLFYHGLRGYALLIGVLAGVLYSVPYLGAISTVLLTAIAAATTGGGIAGAFIAAGGVLALNQIFDYVVMPKVVGESSGIHPLLTMFALFLGHELLGFWGMLLAVPLAASVQAVLFRLYPQLAAPTPLSLLLKEREHKAEEAAEADVNSQDKSDD